MSPDLGSARRVVGSRTLASSRPLAVSTRQGQGGLLITRLEGCHERNQNGADHLSTVRNQGQNQGAGGQGKIGVSGGKATGAVLTGELSLLATGLSRKHKVTELTCKKLRRYLARGMTAAIDLGRASIRA